MEASDAVLTLWRCDCGRISQEQFCANGHAQMIEGTPLNVIPTNTLREFISTIQPGLQPESDTLRGIDHACNRVLSYLDSLKGTAP